MSGRQRQISKGKDTVGYKMYIKHVSIEERADNQPSTPSVSMDLPKREFDRQYKIWRVSLHFYDNKRWADYEEIYDMDFTIPFELWAYGIN